MSSRPIACWRRQLWASVKCKMVYWNVHDDRTTLVKCSTTPLVFAFAALKAWGVLLKLRSKPIDGREKSKSKRAAVLAKLLQHAVQVLHGDSFTLLSLLCLMSHDRNFVVSAAVVDGVSRGAATHPRVRFSPRSRSWSTLFKLNFLGCVVKKKITYIELASK